MYLLRTCIPGNKQYSAKNGSKSEKTGQTEFFLAPKRKPNIPHNIGHQDTLYLPMTNLVEPLIFSVILLFYLGINYCSYEEYS